MSLSINHLKDKQSWIFKKNILLSFFFNGLMEAFFLSEAVNEM